MDLAKGLILPAIAAILFDVWIGCAVTESGLKVLHEESANMGAGQAVAEGIDNLAGLR